MESNALLREILPRTLSCRNVHMLVVYYHIHALFPIIWTCGHPLLGLIDPIVCLSFCSKRFQSRPARLHGQPLSLESGQHRAAICLRNTCSFLNVPPTDFFLSLRFLQQFLPSRIHGNYLPPRIRALSPSRFNSGSFVCLALEDLPHICEIWCADTFRPASSLE